MKPLNSRIRLFALLALFGIMVSTLSGCLGPDATVTPAQQPTNTPFALRPTATAAQAAIPPTATTGSVAEATATTGTVAEATATTGSIVSSSRASTRPIFAVYNSDETQATLSLKSYTVAPDLSNISNPDDFTLTDAQKALLAQNAFVVAPPPDEGSNDPSQERLYRQFFQVYEDGRYSDQPAFVTTDSVLHVYHLMFDKLLRTVESTKLTGYLQTLTKTLLDYSQQQYDQLKGTAAGDDALRNVAYLAVAQKLIQPDAAIPAAVQDKVSAELKLIDAHAGLAPSNIFADYNEDFSQYVPRGHYTRTPELMNYFRTMMWFGRMTFRLKDAGETRSAILLSAALQQAKVGDQTAADVWQLIYDPTVFFVGEADDLSYFDYQPLIDGAFGASFQPTDLNDDAKLSAFMAAAQALRGPRINSMFVYIEQDKDKETKGLRLMGQRFTVDEYVFGQLVWRNVGSAPEPDQARWLPKALDFPAALGNETAYRLLQEMGETTGAANVHYPEQMSKVRQELASLPQSQWTDTLYWAWLYTFRPLLAPTTEEGYPQFMRSDAWAQKELLTVSGSYTELKHDTVLYAKQIMAEAGGEAPQNPKGYVEPYPVFYARVAALVRMTIDGLSQRGLLPADLQDPLDELAKLARDLQTISRKELVSETLTQDEYDLIHYYGAQIEHLTYAAADLDGEGRPVIEDQESALVTDIASDPNGNVLQEATGRPMEIFVVVPIGGKLVLTRGAVYSQYEFKNAAANRLTDDSWKEMLRNGQIPALADWTKSFVAK